MIKLGALIIYGAIVIWDSNGKGMNVKILLIENQNLLIRNLKQIIAKIEKKTEIEVVRSSSYSSASKIINEGVNFNLALISLHVPLEEGPRLLTYFSENITNCPVFIISSSDDNKEIKMSLQLGAKENPPQVLNQKNTLNLINQIITQQTNESFKSSSANRIRHSQLEEDQFEFNKTSEKDTSNFDLTPRQVEVLKLLVKGKQNKEIASELDCAESTVKAHVSAVLKSLGVKNRTQASWVVEKMDLSL